MTLVSHNWPLVPMQTVTVSVNSKETAEPIILKRLDKPSSAKNRSLHPANYVWEKGRLVNIYA